MNIFLMLLYDFEDEQNQKLIFNWSIGTCLDYHLYSPLMIIYAHTNHLCTRKINFNQIESNDNSINEKIQYSLALFCCCWWMILNPPINCLTLFKTTKMIDKFLQLCKKEKKID